MNEINKQIDAKIQYQENLIIGILRRVGIEAVNNAREQGAYTDRTSNLRNSTGFLIAKDGQVVESFFSNEFGESYAKKILVNSQKGIVLIVVAGMHYAVYVESKGFNVLESARLFSENEITRLVQAYGNDNRR